MTAAGRSTSGERFFLPEDPLISDFVADLLRKNRSARTMEAYARDLEHFGRYLHGETEAGSTRLYPRLREATASDIRKYVLHLMTVRRYRVVAVRRNLSALRTFYTFLRREGIRTDQPALDVELPKAEQRKPKVLRLPEVASMLKTRVERPGGTSLAPRDRAIIELLYGSGIRRAELAGLNLDDVDLGSRVAMVTGKGNKRRMVPLTEAAAMAMQQYLHVRPATSDRASQIRNARLGLRQVWKIVKDYAGTAASTAPPRMRCAIRSQRISSKAAATPRFSACSATRTSRPPRSISISRSPISRKPSTPRTRATPRRSTTRCATRKPRSAGRLLHRRGWPGGDHARVSARSRRRRGRGPRETRRFLARLPRRYRASVHDGRHGRIGPPGRISSRFRTTSYAR